MWLSRIFKDKPETPRLTAIYLSVSAGEPMQSVSSVTALADMGLSGDRYTEDKGFWKSVDSCQVTLITQQDIDRANKRGSATIRQKLAAGDHRRNLVISGLTEKQLSGSLFAIGEAVFRYRKPRPPCAYLDRVSGEGMCKALGKHSGACIEIITSGCVSVGDAVKIIK